jgi:hypothetical protein
MKSNRGAERDMHEVEYTNARVELAVGYIHMALYDRLLLLVG